MLNRRGTVFDGRLAGAPVHSAFISLAPGAAKDNPIAFPFRVANVVIDVGLRTQVYVSHKILPAYCPRL